MDVQGGLDLDHDVVAYGELAGALASGGRARDEVLAERELDEDAWAALDDRWQERLSDALAADGDGVPPLVAAHAEAFARGQRRARAGASMPLDRFAEATALVQRGGDVPGALARIGVDVASYLAASRDFATRAVRDPALASSLAAAVARASRR